MTTMERLSLDSLVKVIPDQVSCEVGGEVVVLSLRTGAYYGLNPVAATIWELMQEPISVAALRDVLLKEFSGVSPEQCTEELRALLAELREMELIEVQPSDA